MMIAHAEAIAARKVNTGTGTQELWLPSKRSSTASRTPANRSGPVRTMSGSRSSEWLAGDAVLIAPVSGEIPC